ncbi:MAG TPA: prepilin-type N-terminal cleavage/methylation domain-containing protein [Steroidobacteraceae bacterium]
MNGQSSKAGAARLESGFTLVELLVALLIGLFLLGGLLTIVQDNRRAFSSQNQLSQLQDAERMAMTLMTDVIQSAGYFPDPTTNTAASALPIANPIAAGQGLYGVAGAAPPGDTITVRYATNSGDGIVNCLGDDNTSGAQVTYTNVFSVVNGQLVCTLNGQSYPLVGTVPNAVPTTTNGIVVNNLSVLYGIGTAGNVTSYVSAANVTDWFDVISVQVTVQFDNPLWSAAPTQGQGNQPQYVTVQRDISVMNQTGI